MRTLLDDDSLLAGVRALAERDAALALIVDRYGPPPLWSRTQGFSTLARIILEQQVSLASARALFERLEQQLTGGMRPSAVLTVGQAGLRSLGVTRQKAAYLAALANRVTASEGWFEELSMLEDEQALGRLCEIRGVGSWTASIYLLMALRRPDVWPPGDLALQKALGRLLDLSAIPTAAQAAAVATRWKPWRSVAARILWHWYLSAPSFPSSPYRRQRMKEDAGKTPSLNSPVEAPAPGDS